MSAIQHEGVNVAPNLGKMPDIAQLAIEIRRRRNWNYRANLRTANFAGWHRRLLLGGGFGRNIAEDMLRQDLLAKRRVHDFVHQPKTRHSVFSVERRRGVVGPDFGLGESFGKRRAPNE